MMLYNKSEITDGYFGELPKETDSGIDEKRLQSLIKDIEDSKPFYKKIEDSISEKWKSIGEALDTEQSFFNPQIKEATKKSITKEYPILKELGETVSKIPGFGFINDNINRFVDKKLDTIEITGNVAGMVNSVVGETFNEFLKLTGLDEPVEDAIKSAMETKAGKKVSDVIKEGTEVYDMIGKISPGMQKLIKSGTEVGELALDTIGFGVGGKTVKKTGDIAMDIGGKTLKETLEKAKDLGETGLKSGFKELYKLNTDTIDTILKNNVEFNKLAKLDIADVRRDIADEMVGFVKSRKKELSDFGKLYEPVRKELAPINVSDIDNIFKNIGRQLDELGIVQDKDGILDFTNSAIRDKTDQKLIKEAIDYVNKRTNYETVNDWFLTRKGLSSMINYKTEITEAGERFVTGLRKTIDDIISYKSPTVKELDRIYKPEKDLIEKVSRYMFDNKGELKDNYIQTIANITGKGKEIKLETLEKINPRLSEQVKMYKALEDFANLKEGFKTGTYQNLIGGTLASGAGAFLGGPVGAIMGALASFTVINPQVGLKILNAVSRLKGTPANIKTKVDKMIDIVKKESTTTKTMQNSIEEALDSVDNIIDNGKAKMIIQRDPDLGIWLEKIESTGKGEGKKLINELKQYADNNNLGIGLEPKPFGEKKMTKDELIKYYEDLGFKKDGEIMIYKI